MEILASCLYKDSLSFDGKLISMDLENPSDRVLLNVIINEEDLQYVNRFVGSTKCITFMCDADYDRYSFPKDRMFREYKYSGVDGISLVDFVNSLNLNSGITNLIRLPDGYSNMRDVQTVCLNNDSVRVIGGDLLGIDGVRIGRFDGNNGSILYCGVYDQFLELPLSEIRNLREVIKKSRKKFEADTSKSTAKGTKEKKNVTKKVDIIKSFSTLFSGVDEEDF